MFPGKGFEDVKSYCYGLIKQVYGQHSAEERIQFLEDLIEEARKTHIEYERIMEVIKQISEHTQALETLLGDECFSDGFGERWKDWYHDLQDRLEKARIDIPDATVNSELMLTYSRCIGWNMRCVTGMNEHLAGLVRRLRKVTEVLGGSDLVSSLNQSYLFETK